MVGRQRTYMILQCIDLSMVLQHLSFFCLAVYLHIPPAHPPTHTPTLPHMPGGAVGGLPEADCGEGG